MHTFAIDLRSFAEPGNSDRFGAFVPPVDYACDRPCTLLTPCVPEERLC